MKCTGADGTSDEAVHTFVASDFVVCILGIFHILIHSESQTLPII